MLVATILTIGGLAMNFIGAGFLAYDVFYGPGARFQRSWAQSRLDFARKSLSDHERKTLELPEPPYTPADKQKILAEELPPLDDLVQSAEAKLEHWEAHDERVLHKGLIGIVLLMLGFLLQVVGAWLSSPT